LRLDFFRALIALAVIGSMTGLMAAKIVQPQAGVPVIATVLGYVFGVIDSNNKRRNKGE
jgi:hypothetical protein